MEGTRLLRILLFLSVMGLGLTLSALTVEENVYRVKVERVNFRGGPGSNYPVLAILQRGDRLIWLENSGSWLKVRFISGNVVGLEGFVHQNTVEREAGESKETIRTGTGLQAIKPSSVEQSAIARNPSQQDVQRIKEIMERMLSRSLLFLGLIKQMEPRLTQDKTKVERVAMVKVVKTRMEVRDAVFPQARVIHYPYINESFRVAEEGDDHYRVELPGRRSGWITKTGVQFYEDALEKPMVKFAGVDRKTSADFLRQLSELYTELLAGKSAADRIVSIYDPARLGQSEMAGDYEKINKYYRLTTRFFEKYRIDENMAFSGTRLAFLEHIRVWGELLLGSETTQSAFAGQSSTEKIGGGRHSLTLGGEYRFNDKLEFALDFGSQKDVMLEVFSQNNIGGTIRYTDGQKLKLSFGLGVDTFASPDSPRSDFSRFYLGGDMDYRLGGSTSLGLRYNLGNQSYANDPPNDHLLHKIHAGIISDLSDRATVSGDLIFESQSGELDNHRFSRINPVLVYSVRGSKGIFRTRLILDAYSFTVNVQNSFTKILGDFSIGGKRTLFSLGGFYKTHPDNPTADHFRLMSQFSRHSVDYSARFSMTLYSSIFFQEANSSCSDLHLEFSRIGSAMTSSFNLLLKYWHSPGENQDSVSVKPHVVDLYLKLGFNLKYLVIGPVIGLHGNILFSSGDLIEREGNLLRVGGFADLNLPVTEKLRILGQGSFEFGNVYTSQYTGFNDRTGEIVTDGFYLRHPTTLHINASAQYQLAPSVTLFARGGYYLVKTGFEPIPGMYPVESNSRFYLIGGAGLRLN